MTINKPRVSEVPDSEEFIHFEERPGSVEVYLHKGYIEISFEENGQKINQAYLDIDGAQLFYNEFSDRLDALYAKDDSVTF